MSAAALPLLTAVQARLEAETSYTIEGARVPQLTALPYMTVGSGTVLDDDDKVTEGEEITFIVEAWSEKHGEQETLEMLAAAKAALHGRDLTVTGWGLSILRLINQVTMLDPDGKTFHGVTRYRAKLKSTA